MPHIESLSALAAVQRAKTNPHRRYPAPERDGDRLYPLARPTATAGFAIAPSDTVYAIGSCFARNVEKSLAAAGLRVLSQEFDLGHIGETLEDGGNFFNKYSIHSVLNELRWALDRASFPGEALLYPLGDGRFIDAQLGMARLDFDAKTILDFRHRYLDSLAAVAEADVVILTLGYVETWYDRHLGLYLNVMPPAQAMRAEPERFEFRVLSYEDVRAGLDALYALLQKHRRKPLKMLITVSPVPLLATFRAVDVLVANAYSKSVQRAAIEEFLIGKTGVDYFPSYEFVTLSNPTVAWSRGDYRHVSQDVVNLIMENVLATYVTGTPATLSREAFVSTVKMLHRLGQEDDLRATIAANRALADLEPDILLIEALLFRRARDLPNCFDRLDRARELAPQRFDIWERQIALCRPMRNLPLARKLLAEHAFRFPERAEFRESIDWI